MKLNTRLKKVADFVDKNSIVMDIGCDHGKLDIYLVKENIVKKAVATDSKSGPLSNAKENIKQYKLEKQIDIRLGDGLKPYTEDIDTVIISGMGGRNMIGIFKYVPEKLKHIKTIILSPNNYQIDIKKFLVSNGFIITKEELVEDNKIIYQVIKFVRGKKRYSKKELFFGPMLLKNKNLLFKKYYQKELKSREILIDILPKNYRLKKILIKRELKLLKEEL